MRCANYRGLLQRHGASTSLELCGGWQTNRQPHSMWSENILDKTSHLMHDSCRGQMGQGPSAPASRRGQYEELHERNTEPSGKREIQQLTLGSLHDTM